MVINYERRWVYLGPPKTGSTTLTYLLTDGDDWFNKQPMGQRVFGGIKYQGQHCMDIPEECRRFRVFASIRNPYSRAVSLWWHWNYESKKFQKLPRLEFEAFLETILGYQAESDTANIPGNGFFHFTLCRWFKWVQPVNEFIRQESLQEDLNGLGLAPMLNTPWQNTAPEFDDSIGRRGDWQAYLSTHAMELIQRWADADFDNFHYSRSITEPVT